MPDGVDLRSAFARSEAQVQAILNASPDAIVSIDQLGVIQTFNPAAERLFGYRASEAIGNNVSMLTPPPHRQMHDSYIQRYLATGSPTVIDVEREVVLELLNLPAVILGFSRRLLNEPLTDEQKRKVTFVYESGQALLELINNILDISKIEAGKVELDVSIMNLIEILHAATNTMVPLAKDKHLELVSQIDPDIPQTLQGDASRLRQILINLLGNAIKFTKQGSVTLRANLEEQTDSHATVRFEIHDTGIGVPPDRQDVIFDTFTQADASTTRKYGGTGLGLAICAQLVALMQGQIGLQSILGKGSTFWFTATLHKPSNEAAHDDVTTTETDENILEVSSVSSPPDSPGSSIHS